MAALFHGGGGAGMGARVEPSFTKALVSLASGSYRDRTMGRGQNRQGQPSLPHATHPCQCTKISAIRNTSRLKPAPTNLHVHLANALLGSRGTVHFATEKPASTTDALTIFFFFPLVCESILPLNSPFFMCEAKTAS